MPYRVRSTDTWFATPSAIVAYQPLAAPDSLAAGLNVARSGDNRFHGTSASFPIWSSTRGWYFNNSHYVDVGLSQGATWTLIVRLGSLPDPSDNSYRPVWACESPTYNTGNEFMFVRNANTTTFRVGYSSSVDIGARTPGVFAISGGAAYFNGVQVGNGLASYPETTSKIILGAQLVFGRYFIGHICDFAILAESFSPSAMWQLSRQMEYCEINPDWSAWGRRRRYFYAPIPPPPPPSEERSVRVALGGSFGAQLSKPAFGSHSGPRRPSGPLGGHRGKLNA